MLGIQHRTSMSKASAIPAVLLLTFLRVPKFCTEHWHSYTSPLLCRCGPSGTIQEKASSLPSTPRPPNSWKSEQSSCLGSEPQSSSLDPLTFLELCFIL